MGRESLAIDLNAQYTGAPLFPINQQFVHTKRRTKDVVIGCVGFACLSALATYLTKSTLKRLLFLSGALYSGHRLYQQFKGKDPLVEAFYKIMGGKENYDALPFSDLKPTPKWDDLEEPIYKYQTPDGRRVLIVKTKKDEVNKIYVFTEQLRSDSFVFNILVGLFTVSISNHFVEYVFKQHREVIKKLDIVGLSCMPTKIAEAIAQFVNTQKK
jgi:hypothetical protein